MIHFIIDNLKICPWNYLKLRGLINLRICYYINEFYINVAVQSQGISCFVFI